MTRERLWNIAKRGALPEEDSNQLREYRAMHEEMFSAVGCERMWKKGKQKYRG